MRLDFFGKKIIVDSPEIIGFYIRKEETDLGSEYTTVGLMYVDGTYIPQSSWDDFNVRIVR